MGLVETEAIVLRTYKLAEADKIAICLTQREGLVRGVARGARKLKSRFGAGLEPFSLISLEYFEKEGQELVSIRRAEILESFFNSAGLTDAVAMLDYLVQLAIDFVPPHQPDENLFRMVRACIKAAMLEPDLLPAITLYYELWMLKLAGFLPDLKTCANCRRNLLDEEDGVYLNFEGLLRCNLCKINGFLPLDERLYKLLRSARTNGPAQWAHMCFQNESSVRQELTKINRRLIARALEMEQRSWVTKLASL
ncbi:MAG: DNA repair protein RecO [Pyrinomonadaceae bacterium]